MISVPWQKDIKLEASMGGLMRLYSLLFEEVVGVLQI